MGRATMIDLRKVHRIGAVLAIAGLALLAACEERSAKKDAEAPAAPEPPPIRLERADFDDLPGWSRDELIEALPALRRSCEKLRAAPAATPVGPDALAGTAADWQAPCAAIADLDGGDDAALRRRLEAHFRPFAVLGPEGATGLFTGYYEATLDGARFPGGDYQYPLYKRPDDLVTVDLRRFRADLPPERLMGRVAESRLVPYHTRREIAAGALNGRNLELLWVDDPVDSFFLHVQGSGVVRFPDGQRQRVGYAASNGHAFTPIGRELRESGALDGADMSMQAIRDWLRENPGRARELMNSNARYIFFRRIDGPGPVGAQGVALTPGRSLAVDTDLLPLGAPMWLTTTYPGSGEPLRRLMVAQDAGAAIRGAVRGDFFWGQGEPALARAGRMKQTGRYWLLLPKSVAARRQPAS